MFQDSMNRAMKHVSGSMGCMLIGFDGIPIASVFSEKTPSPEAHLVAMSVEAANMLRKMHRMATDGELAYVGGLSLMSERMTTLARVVQREYLLVMALEPEADVQKGLKMLRLISPAIEREM